MAKEKKQTPFFYGGQAVMEGVMMRGRRHFCVSVRNPQGKIESRTGVQESHKTLDGLAKIPILRGIVSLGRSMMMGLKVMRDSAEIAGEDVEATPSKFDIWLEKKFGDKTTKYMMMFSVAISLIFSVALFMALPTWLSGFLAPLLGGNLWALGIIEGFVRLAIFMIYLILVSQIKEIKRVFQYHGAEHKVINCYEKGDDLTVENVARHNRLHKRCGTSFLLFVMIISMIFFLFVRTDVLWMRVLSRILFVPFIAGVSFEVIKWAGISKNPIVAIISFPGLMLQKITTAEPDAGQIEVAITAFAKVVEAEEGRKILPRACSNYKNMQICESDFSSLQGREDDACLKTREEELTQKGGKPAVCCANWAEPTFAERKCKGRKDACLLVGTDPKESVIEDDDDTELEDAGQKNSFGGEDRPLLP